MSTSATRYGPHDPETAPTTARRYGPKHRPGKRTDVEEVPMSKLGLRQREQINRIAHGDPLTGLRGALCGVCSKPEADCLADRPGRDDHDYEPPRGR